MDDGTTVTFAGMRTAAAGKVDIDVRFPTDEEWSLHHKRRKIFRLDLGRGNVENQIESAEADAKLYEAIKLNGAPTLTQAEAGYIIEKVGECTVLGVELRDDDADVQLQTVMGLVKHTVRIPNMDEVRALNRSGRYISMQFNRSEVRPNLEAAATLWDKCNGRGEGYKGPVPNIHKDLAIRSVIQAIEQEVGPRNDEANF